MSPVPLLCDTLLPFTISWITDKSINATNRWRINFQFMLNNPGSQLKWTLLNNWRWNLAICGLFNIIKWDMEFDPSRVSGVMSGVVLLASLSHWSLHRFQWEFILGNHYTGNHYKAGIQLYATVNYAKCVLVSSFQSIRLWRNVIAH